MMRRGVVAACSALIAATCSASCHSPTTSNPVNAAPTVSVAFEGPSACTPLPEKPCTLAVRVTATDPDGDRLVYAWSGCATGTSTQATCTVERPGSVAATVGVSDGHGHVVTGTAVGEGTNHPPFVACCAVFGVYRFADHTSEWFFFNIIDPDEGGTYLLCGPEHCQSATASGPCRLLTLDCTCRSGTEAEVWWPTGSTGTCMVTFNVMDSWGLVGTTVVPLPYPNEPGFGNRR